MRTLRRFGRLALAGAVLVGLSQSAACVRSKGITAEEKDRLKDYIVEQPPSDMKKLDVNFENKVRLLGYKVEPELARPGQDAKVTFYWKSEEKVEDGWLLFTHVFDEASGKSDNLDWAGPIREIKNNRQLLGPERWEPGKIYVDEQKYRVPDWVQGPELVFFTGIWKGEARLRIVSGPNDGENRAIAAKVKTGLARSDARSPTDIPQLRAVKLAADQKITIDGKGDEPAWKNAASTGAFVDVGTGRPAADSPVSGEAKVTWDDASLYLLVEVKDQDVIGGFDLAKKDKSLTATGQPRLWTRDTAEIMIDPDGDGDNVDYYEIQIGPQNLVFKSQFDSYNTPKSEPDGPFGHEDWDPKMKTAVVVNGTLDKGGDKDVGYTVEAAIPWAGFTKAKNRPPKHGDVWRVNFYAMQNNGGTAWSPILGQGNFHKASRFGRVTWVVPGQDNKMWEGGDVPAAASAVREAGAPGAASGHADGALPRLKAVVPKGAASATP